MLFDSKTLFKLRLVCSDWFEQIKCIWCQVVKDEMLSQVQNLDLLYEKETTAKLLEFKMKYLVSYAQLMHNYFVNMVFTDIQSELERVEALEENADLNKLGSRILFVVIIICLPQLIEGIPLDPEQITDEHLTAVKGHITSQEFLDKFKNMCQMDVIPDISLQQIKAVKSAFIDTWLANN